MSNEEINNNMSETLRIQELTILRERKNEITFEAVIIRRSKAYLFTGFYYKNNSVVQKSSCYFSGSISKRETKSNVADTFIEFLQEHFLSQEIEEVSVIENELNFEELPEVPPVDQEKQLIEKKNPFFSVSLVYKEGEVIKLYAIIVKDANNKEEALGKAFFYFREQTEYLSLIANIVIEIED
jgi:hypothetical protein